MDAADSTIPVRTAAGAMMYQASMPPKTKGRPPRPDSSPAPRLAKLTETARGMYSGTPEE